MKESISGAVPPWVPGRDGAQLFQSLQGRRRCPAATAAHQAFQGRATSRPEDLEGRSQRRVDENGAISRPPVVEVPPTEFEPAD